MSEFKVRFPVSCEWLIQLDRGCPTPKVGLAKKMNTQQMELNLAPAHSTSRFALRYRRQQISHWWFSQMRLAVERNQSDATDRPAEREASGQRWIPADARRCKSATFKD